MWVAHQQCTVWSGPVVWPPGKHWEQQLGWVRRPWRGRHNHQRQPHQRTLWFGVLVVRHHCLKGAQTVPLELGKRQNIGIRSWSVLLVSRLLQRTIGGATALNIYGIWKRVEFWFLSDWLDGNPHKITALRPSKLIESAICSQTLECITRNFEDFHVFSKGQSCVRK